MVQPFGNLDHEMKVRYEVLSKATISARNDSFRAAQVRQPQRGQQCWYTSMSLRQRDGIRGNEGKMEISLSLSKKGAEFRGLRSSKDPVEASVKCETLAATRKPNRFGSLVDVVIA